ncbi:MAG: ABC transporter permease subunit [Anaerolineales bacterium]|nr:ABC transporter permease subunit [Anaerolineales bacterium]
MGIWQAVRRSRSGMVGLAILCFFVTVAVVGQFITPYDPFEPDSDALLSPPSMDHLMGTDQIGRDLLSRIIAGAAYSLGTAFIATSVAALIGVPLGLISGFRGGKIGQAIDFFSDSLLAFPGILLALAIVAALGPGFTNAMIAIGISFSPLYIRLTRGQVMSVKENTYVDSARVVGASNTRILTRHIFPNVLAPLIVASSMAVGGAIMVGAGLSYLGLGAQPPIPEWGALMNAGIWLLSEAPWVTFFPGLVIMVTILAANLLGDGLRDALDPTMGRVAQKRKPK